MKKILFFYFCLLSCTLSAQEICNNAIDDDGDDLIDLLDPDCACSVPAAVPSFLPNPSFEVYADNLGCNSFSPNFLPQDINQANCLESWQQVSDGTTDAWNSLSFSGASNNFPNSIPLPMPDGQGAVGFWVGTDYGSDLSYREYIGACLGNNPLKAGVEYTLSFDIGFILPNEDPGTLTYSPSPVKIAVYGVETCNQLFFDGIYCPELAGAEGYVLLGEATVGGTPGSWSEASVTFTPTTDINGMTIGGSCDDIILPPLGSPSFGNYYLLDQLILNEGTLFNELTIGPISPNGGTWCEGDLQLEAPAFPSAVYQWYKDGIALVDEIGSTYNVPADESGLGSYEVLVDFGDSCGVSIPYLVALPILQPVLQDTLFLCDLFFSTISVPGVTGNDVEYFWEFNGTTSTEPTFDFEAAQGTIYLTLSKDCVVYEDSIAVILDGLASIETTASQTEVCGATEVEINTTSFADIAFVTYQDLAGNSLGFSFGGQSLILTVTDDITVISSTEVCGSFLSDTVSIQVTDNLQFSANLIPATCGQSDGAIQLTVPNNNLSDLSIIWEDENGNTFTENDLLFEGLSAGTYSLNLSNTAGCTAAETFVIDDILALEVNLTTTNVSCFGTTDGSAALVVNSGNLPITYQWFDSLGMLVGNAAQISNLSPGTYEVIASDAANCESIQLFSIEPAVAIDLSLSTSTPECSGGANGTATVQVSGGTAPFTFAWTDVNGLLLSNGDSIDGLLSGAYELVVTDAFACTMSESFSLASVPPLAFNLSTSEPQCSGSNTGSASIEGLSGGTAPYDFAWLDANGNVLSNETSVPNLFSGAYSIILTDANNCTSEQSFELSEPEPIEIELALTAVNCFGTATGAASLEQTNGVEPLSYQWLDDLGNTIAQTAELDSLAAGNYSLILTDAIGCSSSQNFAMQNPPPINYSLVTVDELCPGEAQGLAYVDFPAGNNISAINWLDVDGNRLSTLDTLSNLNAGTYTLLFEDDAACTYSETFQISAPPPIELEVEVFPIPCNQSIGGQIGASAFGGTPPYIYNFQDANYEQIDLFSNLSAGSYPVQAIDANGCTSELVEATITEAQRAEVSLGGDRMIDLGEEVRLEVLYQGFDNPTIEWQPAALVDCENCTTFTFLPINETTIQVSLSDEEGCTDTDEIKVQVNKPRDVYVPNAFSPNGDGANDDFLVFPSETVEAVRAFRVFNRWGAVVYETQANQPWDGRFRGALLDPGVYVWMAEVVFIDGFVQQLKGDVTLIR